MEALDRLLDRPPVRQAQALETGQLRAAQVDLVGDLVEDRGRRRLPESGEGALADAAGDLDGGPVPAA
ncbi:hypothetical protein [Microbispora sp. GKU 823]|uniref:hypothetical protein n=1 Tax=Microbispora sp. GKU 823 TaxID=1652100 RepID=UPI00117D1DD1|nr:hypothetical protein [Microbispora sp. GKU 823]